MAGGILPPPGSRYGPCLDTACCHKDCEFTRLQAACVCKYCGQPIGYEADFYVVGSPFDLAHCPCAETAADAEYEAYLDAQRNGKVAS